MNDNIAIQESSKSIVTLSFDICRHYLLLKVGVFSDRTNLME